MGKKKWQRVSLADLAGAEKQKEILGLMQANGQPGVNSPEGCSCAECTCGKWPHGSLQVER